MFYQEQLHHRVKPAKPQTYELVVNYRSHGGIVNCARPVIDLITLYWPHSIDILEPERASVGGFRPIFFSSQENVILFLILQQITKLISVNRMILKGLFLVMAKGGQ